MVSGLAAVFADSLSPKAPGSNFPGRAFRQVHCKLAFRLLTAGFGESLSSVVALVQLGLGPNESFEWKITAMGARMQYKFCILAPIAAFSTQLWC